MDEWVFPGDALKYAIESLCKLTQDEEHEINAAHEYVVAIEHLALLRARRWGQALAVVGGKMGAHGYVMVRKHVADAACLAAAHPHVRFGQDSWAAPAFRAAVRANADPEWAGDFKVRLDATYALGGSEATRDFLRSEFPPLTSPEDRRQRWEDERVRQEHLLFEQTFTQEDTLCENSLF